MDSKNYIEKVAIVGAGGNCGSYIAEALLKTKKHNVSAVTRADSTNKLPEGVNRIEVDYNDQSSLVHALQGQDALIITMSVTAQPGTEAKLIDAAAEAGVPWILPNEWGVDSTNTSQSEDILIATPKRQLRKQILDLGVSSFIGVSTGFWYEWSLAVPIAFGFDFKAREVTLYDEGDTRISISTWPQVGRAAASLLSLKIHPDDESDNSPCLEKFKNDFIYVNSFTVSQKELLESALRVTGTSLQDWNVKKEPVKARYADGLKEFQGGDRMGFGKLLYARVFYPDDSGNTEKTRGLENKLLGLPKEDMDEYTRLAIERSKTVQWG
ncbi:hypothetical protein AAFC00_002150 [Neodothiora populina]|uniref:NmrA-like domain-containing protein n=1 Tax=Neodothiora populina TaxID=2781224 RepID=A0ABR3PGF3_9PEZI